MYRFNFLNGILRANVVSFAHMLGEIATSILNPGSNAVIDESMFAFNGQCPVKRYIPRKPHPNGLLAYGLAGYLLVGSYEIPIVYDYEPYHLENLVGPQDAMMRLLRRIRKRRPEVKLNLFVDSAFGSFERMREINEEGTSTIDRFKLLFRGADATMSMPANCEKGVWELLDWNCGLDAGRTAFVPESRLIVSSYKVVSESTQKEHQIKTILSGATITQPNSNEETVLQVLARKEEDGIFKYQAIFASGELHWLPARDFIDVEGVISDAWLTFAKEVDLKSALSLFTASQLKVYIAFVYLMLS